MYIDRVRKGSGGCTFFSAFALVPPIPQIPNPPGILSGFFHK